MKFRKLKTNEIKIRVQSVNEYGVILLLYTDARTVMNILDDGVGVTGWKREHSRDNKNCTISIWDNDKRQWISKEDTGTASNTAKEKGLASDSFKRAAVNCGIARELYETPHIKINNKCATIKKKDSKFVTYDKFTIGKITYDSDGNIDGLTIQNLTSGKYVFTQMPKHDGDAEADEEKKVITDVQFEKKPDIVEKKPETVKKSDIIKEIPVVVNDDKSIEDIFTEKAVEVKEQFVAIEYDADGPGF